MCFLIDAQLPPAFARWLTGRGHIAEHVADLGMTDANDRAIWDRALGVSAVILTRDQDFAVRRAMAVNRPQGAWLRCGNTTRRVLLLWFEPHLASVLEALRRGEPLIEVT